ncbi:unnamed protein product, partial [Polarella glacialis]
AISLREIDSESNDLLIEFKRWADEEFGGIRTAFKVLDKDRSNELTLQEFSSAVRSYGFNGKEVLLFRCLDVNSQGKLQLHEVSFLDDWELENPADELENAGESGGIDLGDCSNPTQSGKLDSGTTFKERNSIEDSMFDYQTAAPGPGAYELLSGFGAMDRMPSARHGGAWSFSKRPEPTWLGELKSVGPEGSVADTSILKRRKPAWAFSRETTKSRLERPTDSPGPGSYELMSASTRSPKFTFGTRRGVVLHPLQKADGLKTRHSVRGVGISEDSAPTEAAGYSSLRSNRLVLSGRGRASQRLRMLRYLRSLASEASLPQVFILRGPPGLGKSSWASAQLRAQVGLGDGSDEDVLTRRLAHICSLGDFFTNFQVAGSEQYAFESAGLELARAQNEARFQLALEVGVRPLFVDSSNLRLWEIGGYARRARKAGYEVSFVAPDDISQGWTSLDELDAMNSFQDSSRFLPRSQLEAILAAFQELPTQEPMEAVLAARRGGTDVGLGDGVPLPEAGISKKSARL